MDGFRPSFCRDRRAGPAGWTCAGGAVRLFAGDALDIDRCHAGRWRARYDCAVCLRPAAREDARTNGERGDWAQRGCIGAGECARDHDHFDGRAGISRRTSAGKKSMGRFHHGNDHSHRVGHGSRFAERKSQRRLDHGIWSDWSLFRGLGRAISQPFSGARSMVSPQRQMAGVGDHDLWPRGLHFARLDAAHAARLSQHVLKAWDGRCSCRRRHLNSPGAANACPDQIH